MAQKDAFSSPSKVEDDGTLFDEPEEDTKIKKIVYSAPFLVDLTDAQQTAVSQFRQKLTKQENDATDDWSCIRFLTARTWDPLSAAEMRKRDFRIRKHWQFDRYYPGDPHSYSIPSDPIVEDLMDVITQGTEPGGCFGHDRVGNPVFYGFYGEYISLPLWKYITSDEFTMRSIAQFEALVNVTLKKSGKPQFLMVLDLGGLTMESRHNAHFIQHNGTINELHYPELFYEVICVNAPKYVTILFNLIKPVLPEATKNKIHFYSTALTKRKLARYIAADQLPQKYGGDVPDEICFCEKSDMTTLEKTRLQMQEPPGNLVTLKIGAGTAQTVQHECPAGRVVKWWFICKSGDILLSVRWTPRDEEKSFVVIREEQRAGNEGTHKHRFPVRDNYYAEEDGKIELIFSNKHSTFRQKEINYCIQIQGSAEEEEWVQIQREEAEEPKQNEVSKSQEVEISPSPGTTGKEKKKKFKILRGKKSKKSANAEEGK